jgi:DNA-binding MarR family transcriptional regulator
LLINNLSGKLIFAKQIECRGEGELSMPTNDVTNQYESLMKSLSKGFFGFIDVCCARFDLSRTQYFALCAIGQADEINMSSLSDQIGVTRGAVSGLIDRLVEQGLVSRRQEASDRRIVYVAVSKQGSTILKEVQAAKSERLQRVMGYLDAEGQTQLLASLAALVAAWDATAEGSSSPIKRS